MVIGRSSASIGGADELHPLDYVLALSIQLRPFRCPVHAHEHVALRGVLRRRSLYPLSYGDAPRTG